MSKDKDEIILDGLVARIRELEDELQQAYARQNEQTDEYLHLAKLVGVLYKADNSVADKISDFVKSETDVNNQKSVKSMISAFDYLYNELPEKAIVPTLKWLNEQKK